MMRKKTYRVTSEEARLIKQMAIKNNLNETELFRKKMFADENGIEKNLTERIEKLEEELGMLKTQITDSFDFIASKITKQNGKILEYIRDNVISKL